MKVSELQVEVLNYFVAKAEGLLNSQGLMFADSSTNYPDFCTEWELAGPIIGKELIKISPYHNRGGWWAEHAITKSVCEAPTPIIAAMRVYVESKFGTEVTLERDQNENSNR